MQDIKSLYRINFKRTLCLIFLFIAHFTAFGQELNKRMLTPKDYALWSFLIPGQLSDNGNWASYRLRYEHTNMDTLFLKSTKGNHKYIFPNAVQGQFNGENDFACIAGDTLIVQNLKTGLRFKRADAKQFIFSKNQNFIAVIFTQLNKKLGLEIRDRTWKVVQSAENITHYSFDPSLDGIAYGIKANNLFGIEMIWLKDANQKKTIIANHKVPFKYLYWQGNSISTIDNTPSAPILFNYNTEKRKLNVLDSKRVSELFLGMKMTTDVLKSSRYSKNGSRMLFWMSEETVQKNDTPEDLRILNTNDKLLYDSKKNGLLSHFKSLKMAVWDLNNNEVYQVTTKDLPNGFLSADYSYAFLYNPVDYEPQTKQSRPYDLYIVDLKTREKHRIIERYLFREPSESPDGKFLSYAKDGQWWNYDIQKKEHICITSGMTNSFFVEDNTRGQEPEPYGIAGWTTNSEIILYDRYDLWKISSDGKVKIRLTKGREIKVSYRIKNFDKGLSHSDIQYDQSTAKKATDLSKGLFFGSINRETGETGLSFWSPKSGVKDLIWTNKKITNVSKAANKEIYVYVDENYETAPRLMLLDGKPKEIIQSNKQQEQFYWGKNERIDYTVNGIKTKGVLFYPAGYVAGRKYPMIVNIYEKQFAYMHYYENPTLTNGAGNNVTNFTLQGYFVLYPDINYEFGNLRESITKSVLAAVDAVVLKGDVYPNKIGLIGHSFGGYETDLIITQTDRFATAVAGAAWTDLVSAYLYLGPNTKRPDFFRTEDHQLRIGKSLYEDMESYLKNSPVLLADKVKTPLLGWVGEDDTSINSLQSMEFFLGLRRAKKEHVLLYYRNEEHQLEKKENAADLSIRIMQWFDYYLKDGKKQDWMNSDYQW